jgi:hypothetical protein
MPKTVVTETTMDRLMGTAPKAKRPRTTGQPAGRPALNEGRQKLMAAVLPATWQACKTELYRRSLAGERVTLADGRDRVPNMGDLIDEAVAAVAKIWKDRG